MPSQVRYIQKKNTSFDHFIKAIIDNGAFEQEHLYFGIEDEERARFVRSKLKTAGNHMDPRVSVKAFWKDCQGCKEGGPSCRYHISYTVYDFEKAKAYMEAKNPWNGKPGTRAGAISTNSRG